MTSPSPSSPAPLAFKNDELILNYNDAVIYGCDLRLIERRTEWLNDSCIHFFFTLLEQQRQSCTGISTTVPSTRRSLLFMDPSVVSFWMHQCTDRDEIGDFVKNTQFPGKEGERDGVLFIPVNDNMSTYSTSNNTTWQVSDSGSHWSLLVLGVFFTEKRERENRHFLTRTLRFWHFDSIRTSGNIQAANDIAAKICLHVYPEASITPALASDLSKVTKGIVHQAETPQQQNGYDCGVHVLGAAKILSKYILMTTFTSDKGFIGTRDSPCRRLKDLEECLRNEIGNDSQGFCSKLRHEISFEIRRLHKK